MAGPKSTDGGTTPIVGKSAKSGASPEGSGRFRSLVHRLTGRMPRLRVRTVVLSAAAVVVLVGGGVWVLYGSPWLRVQKVGVSGVEVLDADEVRTAAAVPLGTPLASVDTDEVETRLGRLLPRIDRIEVVRSWPRGIGLKIVERKPVLLVEKGGKFIEVDEGAVRFATVDRAPSGIPVLELTPRRTVGPQRFAGEELTLAAVDVVAAVPTPVVGRTRTVKVRSYDSITLELADGRTVDWGSSERGEEKGAALTALMKAAPKARHFDVSVPTAPASAVS
ncbi:cell division protein FtsQ/DivIB [Streptomyces sp. NPDC002454]